MTPFFPTARVQTFAGPLLLFGLVILANFNIVFLGQTLVATSNSDPLGGGTALRPGRFHGRSPSINWHDIGGAWWQWEPAGKMMSHEFRSGRIPLWDPEVGGGVDAHVNTLQTQYYPPYIVLLLAGDTPLERDGYYLAEIYVAGLFTYLFLRRNGCGLISAVSAGALYMLGGAITQNVNSSFGQTLAVLPLMVWAIDVVLRRPTWRTVALSAVLLAIATLSSFIPAVVSGFVLVVIYLAVDLAWRAVQQRRATRRLRLDWDRAGKAVAAIALSILLAAFLLWPVQLASRQDPYFTRWYHKVGLQHIAVDQLLTLVSPLIGFDSDQQPDPRARLFADAHTPSPFYAGLAPVLLAILAFLNREPRARKLLLFFSISTLLLALKLTGTPPVQWIGLAPVFRDLHFVPYFYGALGFSLAGLAGLGIQVVMSRSDRKILTVSCVTVVALALLILLFFHTHSLNSALGGAAARGAFIRYGEEVVRLVGFAGAFLGVLFLRMRFRASQTAAFLLLAIAVCDLLSLDVRPRFLRSDVWSAPPAYIRFLQGDRTRFRVASLEDAALPADTSQAEGLDVLSSRMAFHSSRYSDLIHRYFDAPRLPYPVVRGVPLASRTLLDILNLKYLVVQSDLPVATATPPNGFDAVFAHGHYQVFRNSSVWPRAYLASAVTVTTPAQVLKMIADLQPGEAVLEEPVPFTSAAGSVDDLRYDFDRIGIRVHAEKPGLLVLGENNLPGWTAKVNEKPAHLYRANYVFQAVEIPAGESDVQFRYIPPGLYAGLAVSTLASLVILGMFLLCPDR